MNPATLAEWRRHFTFLLLVALGSLLIGMGVNALRSFPLPLVSSSPPYVDLDAAVEAFENQQALFIDAREAPFFQTEHIAGAYNVPRSAGLSAIETFDPDVNKDQPLIIYCSEPECTDSVIVARRFLLRGHTNVQVFKGGWEEWQAAALPSESGS